MGPTFAAKSEEKKQGPKPALDHFPENEPQGESLSGASGAAAGMPLFLRRAIQAKLVIGAPDDPLEREADLVAQRAAQGGAAPHIHGHATGRLQRKCDCDSPHSNGKCAKCQEEEERRVQAKSESRASAQPASAPLGLNTSSGSPLAGSVKERVEPVLGADLSHVRVHTDSAANASASAIKAKAFTHQNHIWLASNQNPEDLDLMAHEAAHVVQQGAGKNLSPMIQRRETTNDGAAPKARLFGRIEEETGEKLTVPPPRVQTPSVPGAPKPAPAAKPAKPPETAEMKAARSKVDRGDLQKKKGEAEGDAHPDIDRPAETQPKAQAGATATKQKVDEPPKPVTDPKAAAGKEKSAKEGGKKAAPPAEPGSAAFASADAISQPAPAAPVVMPTLVSPVDSAGQPLPPNESADAQMTSLAMDAQVLRDEGFRLRQAAAEMRSNAHALRGNMQMVASGVGQSEANTAAFHENSKYRHDAAGQADKGLTISEEKAATVAKEAPGGVEKATEQKKESGEVAAEAGDMAGESASQNADDEEAAAKAQENSGKMNKVSSDIGTIDDAVGQAQTAATQLVQDAETAKSANEQTKVKMSGLHETLAQTDAKLTEMDGQNAAARARLAQLATGPDQMLAEAQALDDQGMALIELSKSIESRVADSQMSYAQGMQSIRKEEEEEEPGGPEQMVQRAPEAGEATSDIDVMEGMPSWLTGEPEHVKPSDEEREQAFQEHEAKRLADIKEIESSKEGGFEQMTAGDKALMALRLTGKNLFGGVSNISWPGWGKIGTGAGHLVLALFDPRSALTGALGGVNMIVNASVTFFKQPSWGGLLKLAADIATGITIILGSIVALAGTIAAIMTALSILSFGALAPICGPVIAFCATVMSTVGGWTFWAGAVAFGLQALVFIKDLYAAATAKTAAELQHASESMTSDAKNAGNAALQAGMGKLAQFGGRAMQAEIKAAGGGVNFAKNLASKSVLGEAGTAFKKGGLKAFGKAAVGGIGKRAAGAGKAAWKAVTHPIETIKDIRKAIKSAPKEEPMTFKEGMSKDFLVGPPKEAGAVANEAKVASATKAAEDVHPAPKTSTAAGEEAHAAPKARTEVDEPKLAQSTKKEGPNLSNDEAANEFKAGDQAPKKKISEGNFKEKADLPNEHEVVYSDGAACRRSVLPLCKLKAGKAEVEDLVKKIAKQTGQTEDDVERFLRLSGQMSGKQQKLASSLVQKAESGAVGTITKAEAEELENALNRLNVPKRADKSIGAAENKLREDPFSGQKLQPDTEAHIRQRWFEYRQRVLGEGGTLPIPGSDAEKEMFQKWLDTYKNLREAGPRGVAKEVEALKNLDIKNNKLVFENPGTGEVFIPDSTLQPGTRDLGGHLSKPQGGLPAPGAEWGKPYHFVEVKDWASMSQTGNLNLILDYIEGPGKGSTLELIIRNPLGDKPFKISGPLLERIGKLEEAGIIKMRYL